MDWKRYVSHVWRVWELFSCLIQMPIADFQRLFQSISLIVLAVVQNVGKIVLLN